MKRAFVSAASFRRGIGSLAIVLGFVFVAASACAQLQRSDMSLDERVGILIRALSELSRSNLSQNDLEARQSELLRQMEEMGQPALRSIVKRMDIREPIAVRSIRLRNKFPGAWEEYRSYRPRLVVDAIAAVLEQITGKELRLAADVFNGEGTGEDRDKLVQAWNQYVDHAPDK